MNSFMSPCAILICKQGFEIFSWNMSTKQGRYLWHLATQDVGTLHLKKKLIITFYVEAGGRGFKACLAGNISIRFFIQFGPYPVFL